MILRRLTPDDAIAFRQIRLAALTESPTAFMSSVEEESAEPLEFFRARLDVGNDTTMLGAFTDEVLMGIVGFGRNARLKIRHTGFIRSMFVSPEWRGRGVGAALVSQAIAELEQFDGLRQVFLEVISGNTAAVALYSRLGFKQYGLQPDALCVDGVFYDDIFMHRRVS